MSKPIRALVVLSLLVGVSSAQSREFWEKKDYRQWSEKECRKLLEDSPWAKSYTIRQLFFDRARTDAIDRDGQQNPKIEYLVQLRSALPIKEALVRLQQISARYEQMNEQQRAGFDQSAEKFLAGRNPDFIVVHVSYSATVQNDDRDLARYWRTQTTESLKNFIFLIGGGGSRVPLSIFRLGTGEAREFQLVFPREHNGHALLGPSDKALMLEFQHPNIRATEARILIEFRVDKMKMNGTAVY